MNMRAGYRSIVLLVAFCFAARSQTLTPGFQFSSNIKPGDSPTVTGTDMAGITTVALKAPGKTDLATTNVQATATKVTFTVPATASGGYTVALSPSTIPPIALTVTPLQSSPIYMPDGQLKSHSIRVYIEADILSSQKPRLRLLQDHAVTEKNVKEALEKEPFVVAPGHQWMQSIDGQRVSRTGTLLLFDLSNLDLELKPMIRVTPQVAWTDSVERVAIGENEVNVGNIVAAISWTLVAVVAALALIILLSMGRASNPILFLTGSDGHLSLAQTQIAFWTVAVGGVVLGYGLIRLAIPDIPTSLLVLMGASLATGGIGFFKDAQKQQVAVNAGVAVPRRNPALGDLVRTFPPTGEDPELSLAKALMIFWTVLLLVLFVAKSIVDGAIWDVPWALVALMGFSQAGYLAPKLAPDPTAPTVPPAPAPPGGPAPVPPAGPAPAPPVEPPPQPPAGT
jgi:hypothetical protein